MYGYVYEVTCKVNGKRYIGQHKSSKFDSSYLGSGTIQVRALEKYGRDNFSVRVLQECNTAEELNLAEQKHIADNNAVSSEEFYNLINYGQQCCFSDDTRHKMSEAAKLRSNAPEFKARMSKLHKGKVVPKDVIERRTASLKRTYQIHGNPQKGKKLSKETIEKMLESRKGYKHSEETKQRISKSLKDAFQDRDQNGEKNPFYGKHHSEETKQAIRQKIQGRVNVNNGLITKQVLPDEVESYLAKGFVLGRLPNKTEPRVWIHNGEATKLIPESKLAEFVALGWQQGRK